MDSKYKLGITELDSQHEEIETQLIVLQQALQANERRDSLPRLLESLCEKLKFHFYAEESIMQVFAYPEFEEHKASHLRILRSVDVLKDGKLTDEDIKILKEQPMQLFFEQILSQDMRFAAFIQRNKERLGIQ
ncbi:MAG: hemerythrin domain-containing protein [Betaproteobacteria bacterium]